MDFFDRYDRFGSAAEAARFHHRYQAIVSSNYELFRDARVLNPNSGDGRWCMAALDAGAVHVVGVETSPKAVSAAATTFLEYGIASESYEFIVSDVDAAVKSMAPGAFDLIVCHRSLELSDPRPLFSQLYRLAPKHVILDTDVSRGEGPIVRFDLKWRGTSAPKGKRRHEALVATPNHELIAFLCDYYRFGLRLVDWQALDIADWTGIHDYERGRRRTYVLDRL
jgi:Methyltransferase domain